LIAHNPHHRLFPRRRQGHAKPVKAIGPRGQVYGVFSHADQAAAALGIWRNAIISALRKGNRAAGYHWRYMGVPDELQPPLNTRRRSSCRRQPIPDRFLPREEDLRPPPPPPPPTVVSKGRFLDARPVTRIEHASLTGREDPDRRPSDFERGRFEKARQYNPALTWEEWRNLVERKPYSPRRRPRLDSGAAKGVAS
jgi:hypothetical protein